MRVYSATARQITWLLVLTGAGIGLFVLGEPGNHTWRYAITVLDIALAVYAFLYVALRQPVLEAIREVHADLQHRFKLTQEHGEIGLVEVHADCTSYDYAPILAESRRLVVVLNDGRTWASVHRDRLRHRFADPSKKTTFILVHPDSPMVQVLARKGSKDVEVIRSRIHDTVQLLEEIRERGTSLEILGQWLFNPHALVLGDDDLVITPFFLSRGGRTLPAYKYRDVGGPCYFRDVANDVERLRMDAQDISSVPRNGTVSEIGMKLRP